MSGEQRLDQLCGSRKDRLSLEIPEDWAGLGQPHCPHWNRTACKASPASSLPTSLFLFLLLCEEQRAGLIGAGREAWRRPGILRHGQCPQDLGPLLASADKFTLEEALDIKVDKAALKSLGVLLWLMGNSNTSSSSPRGELMTPVLLQIPLPSKAIPTCPKLPSMLPVASALPCPSGPQSS